MSFQQNHPKTQSRGYNLYYQQSQEIKISKETHSRGKEPVPLSIVHAFLREAARFCCSNKPKSHHPSINSIIVLRFDFPRPRPLPWTRCSTGVIGDRAEDGAGESGGAGETINSGKTGIG